MNLVLAETEEYRKLKPKKVKGETAEEAKKNQGLDREVKRALGLIILRGENIVTISAEAPPNIPVRKIGEGVQGKGPAPMGKGVPINRGMPIPGNMP